VQGEFASRPKIDAERVRHLLDRFAGFCNVSGSFCLGLLLAVIPEVSQGGTFYRSSCTSFESWLGLNVVGQRAKGLKNARRSGNPERRP
jgi:hypothetical protein